MQALTQAALNRGQCVVPDCKHVGHDQRLWFHSRCHPHAAVQVYYEKGSGVLTVACFKCHAFIAEVKVAAL